ncbi:MAG: hypothetical protein ACI915_004332 [Gammaproteobacteria bacterium]|jgi:hypothetical protein
MAAKMELGIGVELLPDIDKLRDRRDDIWKLGPRVK